MVLITIPVPVEVVAGLEEGRKTPTRSQVLAFPPRPTPSHAASGRADFPSNHVREAVRGQLQTFSRESKSPPKSL